ncbi:MAG TPA: hypothetical protein VJ884_00750 [Salinibacter sp.]|nr:hypothetical protein [Salinibacter sp.]
MRSFIQTILLAVVATGFLFVAGCQGSGTMLTEETEDEIPWNSNVVLVETDVPADSLYSAFRQELKKRQFTLKDEKRSEHTTSTEPKDIGQRVVLVVNGDVNSSNSGSTLKLTGMTGDASMNETAAALTDMEGGSGEGVRRATWYRAGDTQRGYAKLVRIAQTLPGTISYKEEEVDRGVF